MLPQVSRRNGFVEWCQSPYTWITVSAAVIVPMALAGASPEALAASAMMIPINAISNALTSLLGSAGVAVLYVELRRAREGVGADWLSKVFE